MRRTINLAAVSLNFFLAYTQEKYINDFICSHSGTLRTEFGIALLFSLFFNDLINGRSHAAFPPTLRIIENDEGVQEEHIMTTAHCSFQAKQRKMEQASESIMNVINMNKAKKTAGN